MNKNKAPTAFPLPLSQFLHPHISVPLTWITPPKKETDAAIPILSISKSDKPRMLVLLCLVRFWLLGGTSRSTALADIKDVKAKVPKRGNGEGNLLLATDSIKIVQVHHWSWIHTVKASRSIRNTHLCTPITPTFVPLHGINRKLPSYTHSFNRQPHPSTCYSFPDHTHPGLSVDRHREYPQCRD